MSETNDGNMTAEAPAQATGRRGHSTRRWVLGVVIAVIVAYAVCYGAVAVHFAHAAASYREYWAAYEPAQQAAEEFAPILSQCDSSEGNVAAPGRIERSAVVDERPSLWLGSLIAQNSTMGKDLATLRSSTRSAVWFLDGGQATMAQYGCDTTV